MSARRMDERAGRVTQFVPPVRSAQNRQLAERAVLAVRQPRIAGADEGRKRAAGI